MAEIYGEETLKVLNSRCLKLQPFGEPSWNFGPFLKTDFSLRNLSRVWSSDLIVCLLFIYAKSLFGRHLPFLGITEGDISRVTFSKHHPCICTKSSPIKYHSGFWFIEENCEVSCWELLENARDTWSHFYLLACCRLSMSDKDCHWDYIDFSFRSCVRYLLTLKLPWVFVVWGSLTAETCVVKSNFSSPIPNCGKRESGNLVRREQSGSQWGMLIAQKG